MDKLYFLSITDQMKQQFNYLLRFVSNGNQQQIRQYHFDIDRKLSLYFDLLVRTIANQTLDIKNNDIVFEKEKHGKPYIKGYPKFYYNISHTRNAIVRVVLNSPVGVDIEKIRKTEYGIAKRFFTANEQLYIEQAGLGSDNRFYEIWTKWESYIKCHGKVCLCLKNTA